MAGIIPDRPAAIDNLNTPLKKELLLLPGNQVMIWIRVLKGAF